jgi:hypothetical protein
VYEVPAPEKTAHKFAAKAVPQTISDVHRWDPETVGLPADFKLTKYSRLKG